METNNAKHFALQLGALITLYVSIGGLISLLFGFINLQFPDATQDYYSFESATSGIRWAIALLVVFFPAYLALTRVVNKEKRTTGTPYLTLTKWLIYLSLLVGGLVILGDLVAVILGFLNGELTTRFLLKALTIFVVVGAASWYYLKDAQGYWTTHERASQQYGGAIALLVLLSIFGGYLRIEAPGEMRDRALDQRQVSDLSQIQSFVLSHFVQNNALPDELTDIALENQLPTAPEARAPYTYTKVSDTTFKLCASFARESDPKAGPVYSGWSDPMLIKNGDDWNHGKDTWCFTRVLIAQPSVPKLPVMN